MKNKHNILLFITILILVGIFACFASGIKIPYFENYGVNFRANVKAITEFIGLDLPQSVNDFLNKTPEPLSVEEKLEIIEEMEKESAPSATPTPVLPSDSSIPLKASSKIVALKGAYSAAYAAYKSKVLCAYDTRLVCYNTDGSEEWSTDIQISNPIIKTAGDYILIAEKGALKSYLFKGRKKLWENVSEYTIISADVSENGDTCIISDKAQYKGEVTVINRKGEIVFKWDSGRYEVIDADISPSSRTLAVALLNTDSGADSKISFFNIKETESFKSADFADSIVFDIEFSDEILNAMADNKVIGLSSKGKISWTREFENKTLKKYFIEDSGYKLCVFDNSNVSEINIINNRGSKKSVFETLAFPDYVYISDGYLLYNDGRVLMLSSLSGKNLKKYTCTRDIYKLFIIDSDSLLVVYNSSLEFINL